MAAGAKQAAAGGSPVISGSRVTWLWRGRRAPTLVGDFNDWDPVHAPKFRRAGLGLWAYQRSFPSDAYIEFAYLRPNGERLLDPLNPRLTPNGFGDYNYFLRMPRAEQLRPVPRRSRGPRGAVTRHRIPGNPYVTGQARSVWLYQPPAPGPYPLLVALDGSDYLRRARLPALLDSLIAEKRIRPLALALCANGGPARPAEYAGSEATLVWLSKVVLPLAQTKLDLLNLKRRPGAFGILGASLGGLMALHAGLRRPDVFGRVFSQAGAFEFWDHTASAVDLVRYGPRQPVQIYLSVGRFDALRACNRRLNRQLLARGYDATYREFNAGHNWPAWRVDLARGLEVLFGR